MILTRSRGSRWVHCQIEYLGGCLPGRIRHALDDLPSTLDGTYERTLRDIKDTNWEFAQRLLLCVTVVSRPLRVEELAELLAFDFEAGQIPTFHEDWRLEDPVEAVLSTCSTLLSFVKVEKSHVVHFSHFSVKEYLTSTRLAQKHDPISSRYHVSLPPAHTLVAQACLGILLHLDKDITRDILPEFPLAEYAAKCWFEHARFEGVSQNAFEGMNQLFDWTKPHLAIWLWIYGPTVPSWERSEPAAPSTPHGTPLHYAAFCGLYDVVEFLVVEHSQDVNFRSSTGQETPLHLTARAGHVEVARLLIELGADAAAQDKGGWTPLHRTSEAGDMDMARFLIEHGADATARDKEGSTPLHETSIRGHVDLVRLLIEYGVDVTARDNDARTPLHRESRAGHVEVAWLLIEHGADVVAQDKYRITPLHRASEGSHVDLAWLLIDRGADATAQDDRGRTPLHLATSIHHVDLARLLIEHGADAAAKTKDGRAPLHGACERVNVELARLLIEHGADAAVQSSDGTSLLHWASCLGGVDLVRLLIDHGANPAVQAEDGTTPLIWAREDLARARLLIEHGADVAVRDKYGSTALSYASTRGDVDLVQLLIDNGAETAAPPMPQIQNPEQYE